MTLRSRLKFLQRTCPPVVACRRPFLAVSGDVCVWVLAYFLNPREINSRLAPWHLGLISTRLKAYPPILDVHRESVSGWGGFSLGVLIASCTANSNLEYKTPKRCVRHAPQASRSSQVVQNQRILVQTRPPQPGGVVNKTQPKAPQPRDTFAMNPVPELSCSLKCGRPRSTTEREGGFY